MKKFPILAFVVFLLALSNGCSASYEAIWDVTEFDDGVFFSGADCYIATENFCPPELGWKGNTVYYIFDLDAVQPLSDSVELEFNVFFKNYGGTDNVLLEVSAGTNKSSLTVVEPSLEIDSLGKFSVLIDSTLLQKGGTNYIKFYGTNIVPTGYGTNPPNFQINYIGLNLYGDLGPPPVLTDEELLDKTGADASKYFYEQALSNGLVKDTTETPWSSMAATGFGLSAFTIMAERYGSSSYWTYTPTELRARTNQILDTLIDIQDNQAVSEELYGKEGLFYHFIKDDGTNSDSEVSTVDTALLFAGVITAGEYFGGEVEQKADQIVGNANWVYFLKTPLNNFYTTNGSYYQFTHGWTSSSGRFSQTWDRPSDETLIISIIALASNSYNEDFQKSFFSVPRVERSYAGYPVVNSYFGSLFTYEFAHAWVDFDAIGEDKPDDILPGVQAVDWWQNSVNGVKAARQFAINNSGTYSSYGPDSWGLSAVQKPNGHYEGNYGALPTDGGTAFHDGTIAPYSSISTMPFFKDEDSGILLNNNGFRTLRHFYDTYYWELWGEYGPTDSFNDQNAFSKAYLGIDQGPIALMIEDYRTGFVWEQFMKNENVKSALGIVFECNSVVCDANPWILHLTEMPSYIKNNANYSGAATAKMILNYLRAAAGYGLLSQPKIYNYGHIYNLSENVSLLEFDPNGMDAALGHFDPYDEMLSNPYNGYDSRVDGNPYQGYNYTIDTYDPVTNPDALNDYMRDIAHWMAYPVTQKAWWIYPTPLVAEPNTPAALPIYGNYNSWVAVNGFAASENPTPTPETDPWYTPEFTLYGFWLTDPTLNGIGQHVYVTADEAGSIYFQPLNTGDAYDGLYVQVAEPPPMQFKSKAPKINEAKVEIAKPLADQANLEFVGLKSKQENSVSAPGMALTVSSYSKLGGNSVVQKKESWRDLVDEFIVQDPNAVVAFDSAKMGKPVFVDGLGETEDYYLVPFNKKGKTVGVIMLDASDGHFRQATWTDKPKKYLPIKKNKAVNLVKKAIRKAAGKKKVKFKKAEARLVWEPNTYSSSPFDPYWEVAVNGHIWAVTMQRETSKQ